MTTPAQDAPLVFPSVAFRPIRLLAICALITAIATAAAALLGHVMFGVFLGVGLALGLINALLVRRAVDSITAADHPLKKKMVLNSATRLLVITAAGLAIAFIFRPMGLGVLFGLALFQVLLVLTTSLPVLKKLREGSEGQPDAAGSEGSQGSTSTPEQATASNDGLAPKD